MKTILCLLVSLFLAQKLNAQYQRETDFQPELIAKANVKYVKITDPDDNVSYMYFNKNGLISKEFEEINQKIVLKRLFKFSLEGLLTEVIKYNDEGKVLNIHKISYNLNKDSAQVDFFENSIVQNEFRLVNSTFFHYDENRNNIKIEKLVDDKITNEMIRKFENKRLVFEKKYELNEPEFEEIKYHYDENGRLEKVSKYISYFQTTLTYKYKYNDGNLVEMREKSSNGVSAVNRYFYDSNNLLKESTWKGSLGKMSQSTKYEYFF